MTETGFQNQTATIFPLGVVDRVEKNVQTAVYPGRLVVRGTTDYDVVPADCVQFPIGFMGFEKSPGPSQPASITTAWTTGVVGPVGKCVGRPVFIPGGLMPGFSVSEGDVVVPWGTNGQVAPAVIIDGKVAVKIPFAQGSGEIDTGVDIPAGLQIADVKLNVITAVSGATISVGIKSTQPSGSATGFINAESAATSGIVGHVNESTTSGNITLGSFLNAATIKSADVTPIYYAVSKGYPVVSGTQRITYTTSASAIAGFILVFVNSAGIIPVGHAEYSATATSTAVNLHIASRI